MNISDYFPTTLAEPIVARKNEAKCKNADKLIHGKDLVGGGDAGDRTWGLTCAILDECLAIPHPPRKSWYTELLDPAILDRLSNYMNQEIAFFAKTNFH